MRHFVLVSVKGKTLKDILWRREQNPPEPQGISAIRGGYELGEGRLCRAFTASGDHLKLNRKT